MRKKEPLLPVLILGLLAFTVLWPLWFTVGGALMASDELTAALGPALLDTADGGYAVWTILPSWPTLQPLAELLLDTPQFFSAFWNTCLLAFAQIAGQLVVAAPASWAFAKLRFAGRRFLLLGYIALMVLPFQVLMVPNYLIATRLGIYDTPLSVILPGVFSAFPVFIMTRSFQDVPNELLEAAKLDGATAWQIFWKIGVPLGYAGIFAALVLNFIEGWNAGAAAALSEIPIQLAAFHVYERYCDRQPGDRHGGQPALADSGDAGVPVWANLSGTGHPGRRHQGIRKETFSVKIVRDSAVRQEPAQPQAVSPEENRFSIRPRQIALFFLWMLAFTLLARGTSGALLPEVQLSTPAPNTITQSLTATGTIQWAAGSLFYLPEGLLVEAVFVSEGEAVQEGDKIAALRREDVEQKLRSLQAELAQKQTEYARLTKPVAADSYDLEKAQQALQAAYQAAENSAAAWAEKEANAGSERDALQRELNERQEKAAQYAREIAEKQAQRELLQQEESPDEEIISRIEAELTQLTAEETQNREALAEAEARLNEADAALESVQSQREEAARTAAQAAEQAEQARNDAWHAYEKSVEAASETAAANAASATVLAEQIREMESSVETLKKLDEQEGVFCAPQTGTVESLQLMQGQTSGQVGGSISDPERGYQIRFALEAEDAVQDTAGVTVTVMQGAKSESVKINSSVSQQDGGVVLSAALTGSDWQVGKAELTIRLSETEYDCCLPVSALHSDNGGDFVYSVEERNTILGLQNIVRKVYVEVVERNNELAALRNYTTGAPVVAATTKSLQEGARVRTAG